MGWNDEYFQGSWGYMKIVREQTHFYSYFVEITLMKVQWENDNIIDSMKIKYLENHKFFELNLKVRKEIAEIVVRKSNMINWVMILLGDKELVKKQYSWLF